MPAAASAAESSARCEVGGWTTIVWTLPRLAVRSGIRRASKNARPGRATAGEVHAEHRAARVEDPRRDRRLGWLARPG